MTEYIIGFKGGDRVRIHCSNGEQMIKDLVAARDKGAGWYCETALMLNLNDISYVLPVSALVSEPPSTLKP